jgi:glycosyltransferase involved in cell wall biosynthesis
MATVQTVSQFSGEPGLTSEFDRSSGVSELSAKDISISVLITCFNYRQYIEDAINSALAQTFAPSEIIVVDDGSTDGSGKIVKERFGHLEKIQILTTPNRGQLAAIREGFLKSTGKIIALLDADDTWNPNYLERVSEQFSKQDSIDFVFANMKFFGAQSGVWNESRQNNDFGLTSCLTSLSDRTPWIGSPTSGLCIRKALFERLLPAHALYNDWRTRADDCLVLGGPILGAHKFYIADTLVNYRIHNNNVMRTWAKENWSAGNACNYELRKQRMLNYYRYKAYGSSKPSVHILHFEFKSTTRPSLQHLWKYLCMLPKTSGSKLVKLKVSLMITKYWWKQKLVQQRRTAQKLR